MLKHIGRGCLVGTFALGGCVLLPLPSGSGRVIQDARPVGAFALVDVESGLRVHVAAGETPSLVGIGDDNLVRLVDTGVTGGALTLRLQGDYQAVDGDPLRVEVVAPAALATLSVDAASQLTADGLAADRLSVNASGSAAVTLAGTSGSLDVTATGASTINARGLAAGNVELHAEGASRVEVCGAGALDMHLSGASRAYWACNPTSVTLDATGASTAQPEK